MRPIDADALKEKIDSMWNGRPLSSLGARILAMIDEAPSIDIEPKHGEWKWISSTYDRTPCRKTYMCSCCRHEIITFDVEPWEHYCPHCGAKMDGEHKEK